jgi:hypothetical protein
MPGFDSTGPSGQGSRTGRKLGQCAPEKDANEDTIETDRVKRRSNGLRLGLGRGLGRGNGRGNGRGRGNQ